MPQPILSRAITIQRLRQEPRTGIHVFNLRRSSYDQRPTEAPPALSPPTHISATLSICAVAHRQRPRAKRSGRPNAQDAQPNETT
jgi:hypothetical protein